MSNLEQLPAFIAAMRRGVELTTFQTGEYVTTNVEDGHYTCATCALGAVYYARLHEQKPFDAFKRDLELGIIENPYNEGEDPDMWLDSPDHGYATLVDQELIQNPVRLMLNPLVGNLYIFVPDAGRALREAFPIAADVMRVFRTTFGVGFITVEDFIIFINDAVVDQEERLQYIETFDSQTWIGADPRKVIADMLDYLLAGGFIQEREGQA